MIVVWSQPTGFFPLHKMLSTVCCEHPAQQLCGWYQDWYKNCLNSFQDGSDSVSGESYYIDYHAIPETLTTPTTAVTSQPIITSQKTPRTLSSGTSHAHATLETPIKSESSTLDTNVTSQPTPTSDTTTSPSLTLASGVTAQNTVTPSGGIVWPATQPLTPEGIVSILPHLAPPGIRISSEVLRTPRHKQISQTAGKMSSQSATSAKATASESDVSNPESSKLNVQPVDLQNVQLVVENIPNMPPTSMGIISNQLVKLGPDEFGAPDVNQLEIVLQEDKSEMAERQALIGTEQVEVNQSDNALLVSGAEEVIVEGATEVQQ